MKLNLKRILLACIFMQACQIMHAQYQVPNSIPTPAATDLGKYGSFPVSNYTGRADVSIPLYTMNVKGVEMPITLSYDTSGILVNSLPGWVGQNWSVITGGVITRVQNGIWDEYVTPKTFNENFTNYFHSYSLLPELIQQPSSNYSALQDKIVYYKNDMEPDIFHFSFMGKSGSFFLGNDGEWKVLSDDNLEIVFDIDDINNYQETLFASYPAPQWANAKEPLTIKGFLIRDTNGTKYYFGGSKDAIDYSINLFTASRGEYVYPWKADSWYLTKVTDRYDNVLYELTYERGSYIVQMYHAVESMEVNNRASSWFGHYGCSYNIEDYSFPYNGIIMSPVYLKNINAADGNSVTFHSDDLSDKHPYDIYGSLYFQQKLKNYVGIMKRVHFYNPHDTLFYCLQSNNPKYSRYQHNATSGEKKQDPYASMSLRKLNRISAAGGYINYIFNYDGTNSRTHLTKLNICSAAYNYDKDHSHIGSYTFKYNNIEAIPQDYLSTEYDHWGYYNGLESEIHSLSDYEDLYYNRQPIPYASQLGMLTEIVYPTGGTSVIEYEQNDFSQCLSDDHQNMRDTVGYAGGLRVKSITEYEDESHSSVLQKKSYSYKIPGTNKSSGQLMAAPRYIWKNWHDVTTGNHASSITSLYRSTSIIPLSNYFGPHLGYSYVEETKGDNSKTRYEYTNFSDGGDCLYSTILTSNQPSPYDKFGDRSYKRGKLKAANTYNPSGQLIRSETHTYNNYGLEANYVLATNLVHENTGNSGDFSHYNGRIYRIFYPKYDVMTTNVKTGSGNNLTNDNIYYQRSNYTINSTYLYSHTFDVRMLKSVTTNRSGKSISESYSYPMDYSSDVANTMTTNLSWLPAIKTEQKENSTMSKAEETKYQSIKGRVLPSYDVAYKNGSTVPDTIVAYDKYNDNGTLIKYTEKGQPQTKLLWGKNDYVLYAKIVDSSNYLADSQLKVTADEAKDMSKLLKRIQSYRQYPFLYVTSYTYNFNNQITSITDPIGYTMYYEYDKRLRLEKILDGNKHLVKKFDYQYKKP